ncbi:MAG: 4-(cytidine 5'-diphospho)-2-C-methyl-D-erythritol kinase [Candidatus Omnitrophica bacterium]|nr:4-(cytidine 5'-diphospho)-2-C-methyl-D-erythritol kinase [Candidatus Omnitrophota bacterium]
MTPVPPSTLTLHPPAKLNLYLAVLGRRPDGYHTLKTLYERLDVADELRLTRRPAGVTLTCSDPSIPTDDRNLVVRAAQLFFQATALRGGVEAALTKRIPVAGGLGGGSSDAASTLLGLNALCDAPLDRARLMALGGQLGADVPFFVSEATVAWGHERGDAIVPVPPPATPLWHVLVNPGIPVLTPEVYAQFDRLPAALTPPQADDTLLPRLVRTGDPAVLAGCLANALEPAIEASYPAIRRLKAVLSEEGALGVLVSGSGPTTFGLVADQAQAQALAARVQRGQPDWTVLVARTALPASAQTSRRTAGVRGSLGRAVQ